MTAAKSVDKLTEGLATTTKLLPENIPVAARETACKALDKVYDAYFDKDDGILVLEERLAARKEKGVGFQALELGKLAVAICGNDMRLAGPMFRTLCQIGETHLRATHAQNGVEPAIQELIPAWPTYKAGVARSLDKGLDPNAKAPVGGAPAYPTASKFITAGKDTNPAAPGEKNKPNGKVIGLELVQKGYNAGLQAAVTVLFQKLAGLNDAGMTRAAQIVAKAAADIGDLPAEMRQQVAETPETQTHGAEEARPPEDRKERAKRGGSK